MKTEQRKDIEKILREGTAVDRAMREAAREAFRRHKQAGVPVALWKNGRTIWVEADELLKPRCRGRNGKSGKKKSA